MSEWVERTIADRATREVLPFFGRAVLAIWDRAHLTLGEVTLRAILERVLYGARARFPVLRALGLESSVEAFRSLGDRDAPGLDRGDLIAAMHAVLTELLALLGTLTADILTPALHDALRGVDVAAPTPKPFETKRGIPS